MTVRAATRSRIEAAHRHGALYRGYLANHLPMALAALDEMGAPDARIAAYAAAYSSRLEPLAAWTGAHAPRLGAAADFPGWLEYYRARLGREGVEPILRQALATLAEAPGSGAFHGMIRTAYALSSGSETEVAHALAYWAAAFESLGEPVTPRGMATPAQALARAAAPAGTARLAGRNIAERMQAARRLPAFEALATQVHPARVTLDALAEAALQAYAATGDFTLLHGLTGVQAARALAGYAPDPARFLAQCWRALAAAYLSCGAPRVDAPAFAKPCAAGWPEILARACRADDEHDVKLAHACWIEHRRTGDDLYRLAAAARLALADVEAAC